MCRLVSYRKASEPPAKSLLKKLNKLALKKTSHQHRSLLVYVCPSDVNNNLPLKQEVRFKWHEIYVCERQVIFRKGRISMRNVNSFCEVRVDHFPLLLHRRDLLRTEISAGGMRLTHHPLPLPSCTPNIPQQLKRNCS